MVSTYTSLFVTVESLRVRNMLENPNAIVAVQVGRSNEANVMGEGERRRE